MAPELVEQTAVDAEYSHVIATVCQYCEVAFHQFRPSYECNRCSVQVCQFCCWHNAYTASCKLCQPELKTDQPAFSFRQLLWSVKLLPFSCRAEKWFYFARRRRSVICASSVSQEQYLELLQQLHATNTNAGSDQQRMIDQDVERTFHHLHDMITRTQHTAFQQPTRNAFRKKVPLSDADFAAWRASTRELLSAFLLLKPQIGYCQGMTHLAAVIVQEAKLNCEIAFRLFLCMTEKYRMDLLYGPDMRDVNLRFFQLDETLRRHLRPLHTHMSDLGVHPTMYSSSWILTLFTDCRVLPHGCALHFLDLFFRSGWKAFYKVTLLILTEAKAGIMNKQSAEDVITVLADVQRIFHANYGKDVGRFMSAANAFKIRNSFLDGMEHEFWSQRSLCE
ncbi:hypothetical protein Gpo141_00006477 [Globisporangium polare]